MKVNWVTSNYRRGEAFVSLGYVKGLYCEGVDAVAFKLRYDPKKVRMGECKAYELEFSSDLRAPQRYKLGGKYGRWLSAGRFMWLSEVYEAAESMWLENRERRTA